MFKCQEMGQPEERKRFYYCLLDYSLTKSLFLLITAIKQRSLFLLQKLPGKMFRTRSTIGYFSWNHRYGIDDRRNVYVIGSSMARLRRLTDILKTLCWR